VTDEKAGEENGTAVGSLLSQCYDYEMQKAKKISLRYFGRNFLMPNPMSPS
jgi:hypothetical protein